MNIKHVMQVLKSHTQEEIRIHKEIFEEATEDVKDLIKKHLNDTMAIHKAFWKKLKKAIKSK